MNPETGRDHDVIENERLKYKKSLGELKEAVISVAAMLKRYFTANWHQEWGLEVC